MERGERVGKEVAMRCVSLDTIESSLTHVLGRVCKSFGGDSFRILFLHVPWLRICESQNLAPPRGYHDVFSENDAEATHAVMTVDVHQFLCWDTSGN
jgi:hypothetical protein